MLIFKVNHLHQSLGKGKKKNLPLEELYSSHKSFERHANLTLDVSVPLSGWWSLINLTLSQWHLHRAWDEGWAGKCKRLDLESKIHREHGHQMRDVTWLTSWKGGGKKPHRVEKDIAWGII